MFIVSCDHADQRWRLSEQEFADTSRGEWGDSRVSRYAGSDEEWYAIHPAFGCGRNAPSPERAISSLLLASGVYHVRIRER